LKARPHPHADGAVTVAGLAELTHPHTAGERRPGSWDKRQHGAGWVFAIANADGARQIADLDTITVIA
jgi:hypothetical protein